MSLNLGKFTLKSFFKEQKCSGKRFSFIFLRYFHKCNTVVVFKSKVVFNPYTGGRKEKQLHRCILMYILTETKCAYLYRSTAVPYTKVLTKLYLSHDHYYYKTFWPETGQSFLAHRNIQQYFIENYFKS